MLVVAWVAFPKTNPFILDSICHSSDKPFTFQGSLVSTEFNARVMGSHDPSETYSCLETEQSLSPRHLPPLEVLHMSRKLCLDACQLQVVSLCAGHWNPHQHEGWRARWQRHERWWEKASISFTPSVCCEVFFRGGSCRCSNSTKMRARKNLGFMWGCCAISRLRENSSWLECAFRASNAGILVWILR